MQEETNLIQEELYPVQDLIENCEALTGYRKEVAVGALFDCGKEEMTKKEFEGRIKKFLGKKVE
ncbi:MULTISPECIES: hypothetical protein [Clostridium]|uniref:YqzN/YkzM domain-containing protein n=2 Tax=Clostridium botulinum TaxID=1491 RepID=C1FR83_CLOBJ|nr:MULTISPECIES: hypothetical protein [Clostridium]ACO86770.1 conserved hypothetical protein [Clostridium botulinum A2 str. Kyoto]AUN07412.1 hypothetical protein RSJ14_12180 [Clostridium botulinum]AUN18208.1 hypothetical protein B2M06_11610 [Clostridium botulinum]KEI87545.1 hypothetical protein N492_11295 [Clostridium botulinum B2 267]KEI92621.1 hypothetical protein N491_12485 [Clostridium botulinum B2 275]